jgi:protein-disulfide isomerase
MSNRYFFQVLRLAIVVSFSAHLGNAQSVPKPSNGVLGAVNGTAISEADVKRAAQADLQEIDIRRKQVATQLQRDEHAAFERALQTVIDTRVMEAEAKKRGMDAESLMKLEVDKKVIPPSDKEVSQFYESNKAGIPLNAEEGLKEVRRYLTDQRREEAYAAFILTLRKQYKIEKYLEPMRSDVATDGFPAKGPVRAPVTIVEFSDFECPFCAALFPILKKVEANYGDRIRIVYRQFPLDDLHPHAQQAAEASLCANEQQKFWEMHDSMFLDRQNLTNAALKQKAAALNLDTKTFNTCLDTAKYSDAINKDIQDGKVLGIAGTPGMFINGRVLLGTHSYEEIAKIIDDELQRKAVK